APSAAPRRARPRSRGDRRRERSARRPSDDYRPRLRHDRGGDPPRVDIRGVNRYTSATGAPDGGAGGRRSGPHHRRHIHGFSGGFMRLVTRFVLGLAALAIAASVSAQDLTGTLKKIKDTGSVTIGYRESSIPFSYLDDKQQPIGYAMDLCMKVVDAVKAELKMPNLKMN